MNPFSQLYFQVEGLFLDLSHLLIGADPLLDFFIIILFWFVWLWVIYHALFKPFFLVLALPLKMVRMKWFENTEEDEK